MFKFYKHPFYFYTYYSFRPIYHIFSLCLKSIRLVMTSIFYDYFVEFYKDFKLF